MENGKCVKTMQQDIVLLAIESSCDETAAAVVKNGREVLSNVIDTQIKIHEKYGCSNEKEFPQRLL